MSGRNKILGAIGVAIIGVVAFLYTATRESGPEFIDPADQNLVMLGQSIYVTHCAVCHGESLQGQENWRQRLPNGRLPAPPHDPTGHTWHHSDAMLVDMVRNGLVPGRTAPPGYESDMPAYRNILVDEDIVAVLAYIKSTWPPEVLHAQKQATLRQQ